MNSEKTVDLLMIGHFARDRIVIGDEVQWSSGGAVYYGAIAAAHLGARVAVATRLGADAFPELEALREAGIAVWPQEAEETSGIDNQYAILDQERRRTRPLGFAGPFDIAAIPDLSARIIAIVPIMAGEVDLEGLRVLATRAPIALDIQGFVRVREADQLVFRPWDDLEPGLARVTYLKADRAEAELLTDTSNLEEAARALAKLGPKEIVLTESSGVTVWVDGAVHRAPFRPANLSGRTGRGDTTFATYLALRSHRPPAEATRWAAAIASCKMEQPGPFNGDLAAVERKLALR